MSDSLGADRVGDAAFTLSSAHWPEVEAGPRRLLMVPVGSLEQHGAHLPLDTDTRIAAAVAGRACAGRSGVGLAPSIAIGASGEHADFPGTLSIGSVALSTLLVELGRHASLHWPAMLLVNGHGGNVTAIRDAVGQLRREGRRSHAWHAGLRPGALASGDGLTPDAHAGRVETSMMLALAPDDVRLDAAAARHVVTWEWVRGHSGHPENERADALARARIAEESWGKQPSALTRG